MKIQQEITAGGYENIFFQKGILYYVLYALYIITYFMLYNSWI